MRLALAVILVGVLLAACGGGSGDEAPREYGLDDTAKVAHMTININTVDVPEIDRGNALGASFLPSDDHHWVVVDLTLQNDGDEVIDTFWDLSWEIRDDTGRRFREEDLAVGATDQPSLSGQIDPNDKLRGALVFEVPDDAAGLVLVAELREHRDMTGFNIFDPTAIAKAMEDGPSKLLGSARITLN